MTYAPTLQLLPDCRCLCWAWRCIQMWQELPVLWQTRCLHHVFRGIFLFYIKNFNKLHDKAYPQRHYITSNHHKYIHGTDNLASMAGGHFESRVTASSHRVPRPLLYVYPPLSGSRVPVGCFGWFQSPVPVQDQRGYVTGSRKISRK